MGNWKFNFLRIHIFMTSVNYIPLNPLLRSQWRSNKLKFKEVNELEISIINCVRLICVFIIMTCLFIYDMFISDLSIQLTESKSRRKFYVFGYCFFSFTLAWILSEIFRIWINPYSILLKVETWFRAYQLICFEYWKPFSLDFNLYLLHCY